MKDSTGGAGLEHWERLIVLDAGQFSTRCRCCGWRSGPSSALTDATAAFQSHPCPIRAIGSCTEPIETPGPSQVNLFAAPGGTGETGDRRWKGGEVEILVAGRGQVAAL